MDRFGLGALVASGTLAAHEVAYLTGDGGSISHGYLGLVGPMVVLAACVAAWSAALRILRHDPGRRPRLTRLAGAQFVLFIVVEFGERLVSDSLASFVSTPVVIGIVVQPLVAWIALALLRVGRRLVEAWRDRRPLPPAPPLAPAAARVSALVWPAAAHRLRVRGPPY